MADRFVVGRNSIEATGETSLDSWECLVAMKGSVLELLAMPPAQPPLLPLGLPSSWCGMPCLTRLLFVKEGGNAVPTILVFLDEGLDGDVWDDCFKGAKSEEMVVFVSFAAMLMLPRGFLDVGPAPCVAGPAWFGHALAVPVQWYALSFQLFIVFAATMTSVESEHLMLETAPLMAGTLRALPDNDFKELEPQFVALDGVLSVKAVAALAGKCVWICFGISKESKRALMLQNGMEEEREKGKNVKREKERVEMKQK